MACGSSYHAALVAKYAIEHWVKLPTEVDIASEFRYRDPVLNERTLCVGVSQSGETLDTSEAIREAARLGAKVLVVSNVVDSSMARAADGVLYTRAGPEIGVASTKCHLAQIVALEVLGLYLAQLLGTRPEAEINETLNAMEGLPRLVAGTLERAGDVDDVAAKLTDARDFFFLGRHVGFPVALEGALKFKELAYLRAEGYPAGELKHGPIALDRAGHGGRGHRHAQPAVGEDAVQHRGGAQPRRHGRAAGRRRRRGVGRRGGPRAVGAPDHPAPLARGRRGAAAAAGLPPGPPARARPRPPPQPGQDGDRRVIIGVGVDAVDVARFRRVLHPPTVLRPAAASPRPSAPTPTGPSDEAQSLAARFAAKEAVMKALGTGIGGFALTDVEVCRTTGKGATRNAPYLNLHGRAAALAGAQGAGTFHLSLTHTDSMAIAFVVAEQASCAPS